MITSNLPTNKMKDEEDIPLFSEQDTQPLPVIPLFAQQRETVQQHYQRLKAISDATGTRLLFVYLIEQKRLRQRQRLPTLTNTNTTMRQRRTQ